MYNSRKGSKTSRLRGIDEFLSIESQPAEQEEEQGAEPVPVEEQRAVDPPMTRAAGKRKLSADEAGQYDKQIRRKLLVDSPPRGQQKSKLMAEAIKAAKDDEPQESSVAGLPHRAGLRSHGPALSGEGSPTPGTTSAAPLEQEPAQVSAPLEEQHLPGSPTATVPPVALPEATAATPPPEQQLMQVSAPMQEQ
ncbi:GATA type zinc finger protein asd-4-like [Asparagus officinalis]|uniref:GATA type zinc finger protein asd-4-like n=1 Tax=Asparagus officinalis TaxID=4686 RepID=UPI00098E6AA7|nr:GATA type zinc finger protein asd-4-like [Asparagus officinalis]